MICGRFTVAFFLFVMSSFSRPTAGFAAVLRRTVAVNRQKQTRLSSSKDNPRVLVLGGTGFLGQTVCKRAVAAGYQVTSLSRRGLPPPGRDSSSTVNDAIDYRKGDARNKESIATILSEADFSSGLAIVHSIGLLFDQQSGLEQLNYYASGSGSILDEGSTYDAITRQTAFHAIDAALEFAKDSGQTVPFCFTSAAEAGWPEMKPGGPEIDKYLAPEWLKRYLKAKREVEAKLTEASASGLIRPIIFRPSLIYSMDRPASYIPVGAFYLGNIVGLPFVDRPVTVQRLSSAIVNALGSDNGVAGVQRYMEIEKLADA